MSENCPNLEQIKGNIRSTLQLLGEDVDREGELVLAIAMTEPGTGSVPRSESIPNRKDRAYLPHPLSIASWVPVDGSANPRQSPAK